MPPLRRADWVAGNVTVFGNETQNLAYSAAGAAMKDACNKTAVPTPATDFDQVTACANFVMETTYTLLTNKTI